MIKTICTWAALMAVALLALPAICSAANDPRLTGNSGTFLEPTHASPIALTGTNEGVIDPTYETVVYTQCKSAALGLDLETNSSTAVEATITSFALSGCSSPTGWFGFPSMEVATNGLPWCLRATSSMSTDEVQIRGNSCTSPSRPIRVKTGSCEYERSTPISGTYQTSPSQAVLSFSHAKFPEKVAGGFGCPPYFEIDMAFSLEKEGQPVYIDNL